MRDAARLLERNMPMMAPSFSPEGRAAVETIKAFIREAAPLDALHERALLLAGLREDDVELGIAEFCQELCEVLKMPKHMIIGFAIASADILREKLVELQARGTGRA